MWRIAHPPSPTREHDAVLELLAVLAGHRGRRNSAMHNDMAVYQSTLTMTDYLTARPVSTPLGLYDCDVPCDGAVAVIVSARESAPDLRCRPVSVEAIGSAASERMSWDQSTLVHVPLLRGAAEHLWSRTSIRHHEIDVAQLYDGFSIITLSWLEALGFCDVGEGAQFIGDGSRIALDGDLPLNTGGGQLSGGRLHGFGLVHEAMLQLRGEAAGRQVEDAQVASSRDGRWHARRVLALASLGGLIRASTRHHQGQRGRAPRPHFSHRRGTEMAPNHRHEAAGQKLSSCRLFTLGVASTHPSKQGVERDGIHRGDGSAR